MGYYCYATSIEMELSSHTPPYVIESFEDAGFEFGEHGSLIGISGKWSMIQEALQVYGNWIVQPATVGFTGEDDEHWLVDVEDDKITEYEGYLAYLPVPSSVTQITTENLDMDQEVG